MIYNVTISDEMISEETGHRQDDVMDTSEELSWHLAPGMSAMCLKNKNGHDRHFIFHGRQLTAWVLVEF